MPSETKSVPPSLSRHRHAWQHRKDLFGLWTMFDSDPCPTPTHTLELGLSTHGGRTRSGMEPSIATSVDDTPCLNIYAPLYMVLNFLGPSILIVQICFVKGRTTKLWNTVGLSFQRFKAKEPALGCPNICEVPWTANPQHPHPPTLGQHKG